MAGSAALLAENAKTLKYVQLLAVHDFVPIAIETIGTWGSQGYEFLTTLGKRVAEATGEPRSTAFLRQRLALAVQRGNAISVMGTLPCSGGDAQLTRQQRLGDMSLVHGHLII